MLTNFNLVLEIGRPSDSVQLLLSDRYNQLEVVCPVDQDLIELEFRFSIPNQLCIKIENLEPSNFVRLKSCCLGGLALSQNILDQICQYTPVTSNHMHITTLWNHSGKIYIDFFAEDWVQYHLLYGNKITI